MEFTRQTANRFQLECLTKAEIKIERENGGKKVRVELSVCCCDVGWLRGTDPHSDYRALETS